MPPPPPIWAAAGIKISPFRHVCEVWLRVHESWFSDTAFHFAEHLQVNRQACITPPSRYGGGVLRWASVCLCLSSVRNYTSNVHPILCVLPNAVAGVLVALRYVMYFRFYEWRHICTQWRHEKAYTQRLNGSSTVSTSRRIFRLTHQG